MGRQVVVACRDTRCRLVARSGRACTSDSHRSSQKKKKLLHDSFRRSVLDGNSARGDDERMKTRVKYSGPGKMDHLFKRRLPNHTEIAYREAVAKLKYLLAESYAPKMSLSKAALTSKQPCRPIQDDELQSIMSEAISTKLEPRTNKHLVVPGAELSSFVERQEQYIEQLEKESEYCREELKGLIERVREVVTENEALQDKSKTNFFKHAASPTNDAEPASARRAVDGPPSIVFESRISELEAQLTQARLELRQLPNADPQLELERRARERRELEAKLEDSRAEAARLRARDAEAQLRAQQAEYRRAQAELEASRLRDELERRQEYAEKKLQEDKRQLERRLTQQLDQIKSEAAQHWEAASKSRLEAEQQRRQLGDLGRELTQKQATLDQLQEQLSSTVAEKETLREQLASSKLATERSKQEQSRLQSEIDLHKARAERADADLAQARREQMRLADELAALEKQISVNKVVEETRVGVPSKPTPIDKTKDDKDKELAALIFDLESKHTSSAKRLTDLGDSLSEQAALVARLADQCQSLTQRLETSDRRHKEEMASLQSKINYLSSKIQESLACREALSMELDKSSPKSTTSDLYNQQQSSDIITQDPVQPPPQPAVDADVIQNPQQITEVETSDQPLDELQYPQQQADYAENYTDQLYATNDQVYDHPAQYYDYYNDQYIPSDSQGLDGVVEQHGFADETCNDQQNYPET